jgi:putative N-acetylmannosamine-6-phosphate epimerase
MDDFACLSVVLTAVDNPAIAEDNITTRGDAALFIARGHVVVMGGAITRP